MVLFFDVTNRLNVFLSFFRRETTGLLLVLLLGICTPATVGPCSQLLHCAACMRSTHSELVDGRTIGKHLITYERFLI